MTSQIKDPVLKQAAADATDWLIRLQEDPENADLKAQFDAWYTRNPTNRDAWRATQKASSLMAQVAPSAHTASGAADWQAFLRAGRAQENSPDPHQVPVHEAANDLADRPRDGAGRNGVAADARFTKRFGGLRSRNRARRAHGSWRAIGLGAFAVAASLLVAIVGPDISTRLRADYVTDTGQMTTITLADNSQVTLAPETALRVSYEKDVRAISLLTGEAFFEVTPDAKRPFTVAARNVNVTVLGTGFDVSDGAGQTRVAVAHGLVRVDNADHLTTHSERLEPGQNVRVDDAGQVVRGTVPTDQIASWRTRQLIAQDQPLGDVVDRLRRYFNGTILITDDALAKRSVTGVYRLSDPVPALRAIAKAQNAVVREITPWVLVVSPS